MDDCPALVVIGASGRFFAASARRAGWRVHVADLFGDLDLREVAASVACARDRAGGYPESLIDAARDFPPAAFCYVGAVENHPQVIRAVARDRRLLGSPPEAVAAVRDPWALRRIVRGAGLASPDCQPGPEGLPADGSYLRKPLASAGGRGIVPWTAAAPPTVAPCVWQRRTAGGCWSAAFVVAAEGGRLVGASRQWTGLPWCHARPFSYCGSLDVPLPALPDGLRRQLAALGPALADCGLRGVVGADLVVDAAGVAWVLEVNPRPTASMELIERASGASIAALHLAACGATPAEGGEPAAAAVGGHHTKAVLYAPHALAVDAAWLDRLAECRRRWQAEDGLAAVADIPAPGRLIPAGGPICTLFATAATAAIAAARLRERAEAVSAMFSPPCGGPAPRPAATPGGIPSGMRPRSCPDRSP